jgi:hypothetical protein
MARACRQWSITRMVNDGRQTDVRILAADTVYTVSNLKNSCCCQQECQSLPCCCPFLQRDLNSLCLLEGNQRDCLLIVCVTCVHLSQSPLLSVAAVCVFACNFFNSQYGRQTDVRILAADTHSIYCIQSLLLSARVPISPLLLSLSPKGPQQPLSLHQEHQGKHFCTEQERGSFQGVLLFLWVAESACKVAALLSIDKLPVLGIL